MNSTTKLALGILGAAAAGVVIGLLIAPAKGSETRERVKRTAGEWADNLTHLFNQGKHAANETANEAKETARQAKTAAEEKVSKIKESFT
jgi:gas vesicle protein